MAGKARSLKDQFAEAKARVEKLKSRPSNEQLLDLYGLYKQATEGDVSRLPPRPARPQGPGQVRRLVEAEGHLEGRGHEGLCRARHRAREDERLVNAGLEGVLPPAHAMTCGRTGAVAPAAAGAVPAPARGFSARDRAPEPPAARAATSLDPARHPRHHPGRRDRSRGAGCRDALLRRSPRTAGSSDRPTRRSPRRFLRTARCLTGLYPAGHGVRENGRDLAADRPLVSERLHGAGYRTAAFVSSFVLARRFGLARGFESLRRRAAGGTGGANGAGDDRPRAGLLARPDARPLFLWVHYFDPHAPYTPPQPQRTRYAQQPLPGRGRGDGRAARPAAAGLRAEDARAEAILVVGDHGEGLGEHGEAQHGNLVYQSTMHVPLLLVGPGVERPARATSRSARGASSTRSSTGPALARKSTACAARRGRSSSARR